MNYIEIADLFLNLDHVAFIRQEEHSQLGTVLAIHFAASGATPLYIGDQHHDELRALLVETQGRDEKGSA